MQQQRVCPNCGGSGRVRHEYCQGTGWIYGNTPGVRDRPCPSCNFGRAPCPGPGPHH